MTQNTSSSARVITLGGGCFWCTEAVFKRVRGVIDVQSGYCNGHTASPTYEQVCEGRSGHAEVVQVTYEPAEVGLSDLLQIFFATHDPTSLNRQGNDVGTQYRSGIYYTDEADRAVAQAVIDEVNQALGGKVVTELQARRLYHPAEAYHQNYFEQHPQQGYCAFVVAPKVHKFEHHFKKWLRDA